jgi:aminopeptidase N
MPTVAAKEAAWRAAVVEDGLANATVEALALGFGRLWDTDALQGFVARYHEMLAGIERKGSHALVEAIVYGFYPRALADERLRDATRTWLAEHPEAADALRRLVTEAVDPIDRALRAQARDAEDA